ncbi:MULTISPECIES: FAD-binding dehydrogenase [Barrientosiimonas]|uniref:FAD-binding dehydrogenase n=1 Tax=Barrientosiimonas endolithica TaxID=1535208 RepID=A0ABM8HFC6_9MICO|nr:FAD-binding dehydrogenase [Barrientosiimonas endolithica]BDZ59686.1 FAD-binding dehydrogenase [Barrientosiimonas endolithica]
MDADAIVVGAGLAGLVAVGELVAAGKRVAVVEQESAANLGGQGWWSFGGLFVVDTPEQRRLGIKDSFELAWQDWQGSAGWDRLDDEDTWGHRWARAYVEFAAGEKRDWLRGKGIRFTPMVGWAERGDGRATGHGNSVPRFHIAWGTGTGVVRPFVEGALEAARDGRVTFFHRHRVDELVTTDGAVTGVRGTVLAPDDAPRGAPSNDDAVGEFELSAPAVLVSSGGIGANHDLVRQLWPDRLGTPPARMLTGVPAYVDGRMLAITEQAGARLVNRDRMWHYTEGIRNWDPVWPQHAIRILPGPSPLWFDALGRLLPAPCLPGYDTLGTLRHLRTAPGLAEHDHSWFVVTQKMIEKEFALSGSEQNPDITNRDLKLLLRTRVGKGAPGPVEAFKQHGPDFVVADALPELVARMNALTDTPLLDLDVVQRQIEARDREITNPFTKDAQVMGIHNARRYRGDRLSRVATPHRVLDPAAGPLIGIKLHVLTRKTLGGVQTDLSSRALASDGSPVPGLYAAGEVAGFGGGGVHGYNALEGTFLGGCLFSGRAAGRAMVAAG